MPYKEFSVNGIGTVKIYKRRNSRSLKLTVTGQGIVHVTIPTWAPYRAGLTFATSKREWIRLQYAAQSQALVHGQPIGKEHRLLFQPHPHLGIKTSVRESDIVVSYCSSYAPTDSSVQSAAQSACWRALRRQANRLFEPRLQALAEQHGFEYRSLSVKRLKSRWGSCDQQGNIVLNLFLVQLPWELIDYVMLHELTHTVVLNHSEAFWQRFETALPTARARRKAMRAYRPALLLADAPSAMA